MYLPILMLFWEFTSAPEFQTSCVNDFSPLIAALATLLTVQAPVLVGLVVNQYKMRDELAKNSHATYTIQQATVNPGNQGARSDQPGPGNPDPAQKEISSDTVSG